MSDHILKLTVIDGGRAKRCNEIGNIVLPLNEFEIGDGSEQQLFKMDLEKVHLLHFLVLKFSPHFHTVVTACYFLVF